MQSTYKSIAEADEMTVVSEYQPLEINRTQYQSEADLENDFVKRLVANGYEKLTINSEADLIANLRNKIEQLNNYKFSDNEWEKLYVEHISNPNLSIVDKTRTIQQDEVKTIMLDNGLPKNIKLLDKKLFFNNSFQVLNQYTNVGTRENRYDVSILINGLPLVHIELKRRGISIKEAFNQIERYQRDSFWANSGLYEFVQIFVISNGTFTKYYSNSTRWNATDGKNERKGRTFNSFEFTSYWADSQNNPILSLEDFTNTFLTKRNLASILSKYCVFTVDNELLVMRPYQICATEKILQRINIAHNYKWQGSIKAGGYIWHTTGSGKTLTSFKTATLCRDLDYIDKVLFVVDRKDLDYQTMKEYDRFEKGCANGNKSTAVLEKQLSDDKTKIIVTTIQKLNIFIQKNKTHDIYGKNVVLVFDECHRSQFGVAHKAIVKAFKKYYIFGFTGTPIFPDNAVKSANNYLSTTEQLFGDRLHTYTIIDAIRDGNVLKFLIDKVKTMSTKPDVDDEEVSSIDQKGALMADARINNNVEYIIKTYARKTRQNESYAHRVILNVSEVASDKSRNKIQEKKQAVVKNGFNGILTVDSIPMAIKYYNAFRNNPNNHLKIATIFSFAENEDPDGIFMDEENSDDTKGLDKTSRDFLDDAIRDYNIMFGTNYDTSSDKFQNYYKDVSMRMKNREIDLLIVVNMFLTGFDAKTLNTLWVDKNLKYHGLLQAFSRTNRIYNTIKAYGNIVCFRNLDKRIEESLSLFGNKDAGGVILLKDYDSYYYGYTDAKGLYHKGYKELVEFLKATFSSTTPPDKKEDKKTFINTFNSILQVMNILAVFDRFENEKLLTEYEFQEYTSIYIDLKEEIKKPDKDDPTSIIDDIEFETELVKQFEIDIEYILALLEKYKKGGDVEIITTIKKLITSSFELRSKKDLIEAFIENIDSIDNISEDWSEFVRKKACEELDNIIKDNNLKKEPTYALLEFSFKNEVLRLEGTVLDNIMPPISIFGGKETKKKTLEKILTIYFDKYVGMVYNLSNENFV